MSGDLDQYEDIEAALTALADQTDPEQVATVTRQYVNNDMITVGIARAGNGGGASGGPFTLLDETDVRRGELSLSEEGQMLLTFYDTDGTTVLGQIVMTSTNIFQHATDSVDFDIFGSGHASLVQRTTDDLPDGTLFSLHGGQVGETVIGAQLDILYGNADPSAGDGVVAATGAMFSRTYDPGAGEVGELWFKTGVTDTDWTKITP